MPPDHNDNRTDNGHRQEKPPAKVSPIVPGRSGRPSFSLEERRERVERQFQEETSHRTDILLDLDSEEKRREMLVEVADYVLAVESITLAERDKRALIDGAYRNLFTFGPLDAYIQDDAITAITINGPHLINVQRGMGKLEVVSAAFDDSEQLEGVLVRVLATGGTVLPEFDPFLEAGVMLAGRAARLSLVAPPVSPHYNLDIRLHPRQPVTLADLDARYHMVPAQPAALLTAILRAGHGLMIVGDVALGKTTLAGALARGLPDDVIVRSVERAAELSLSPAVIRHVVRAAGPAEVGSTFEDEFMAALDEAPDWLIVDEIRGDESAAVWSALNRENPPHYLWVFRGAAQADRLRSALGMVIRKRQPLLDQATMFRAIADRVPFVAAIKQVEGNPCLAQIAEWTLDERGDEPVLALRPILVEHDGGWLDIENRPTRTLDLPDEFWGDRGA